MHGRIELTRVSRTGGGHHSARENVRYIMRTGPYQDKGGLVWQGEGNLPAWARATEPGTYPNWRSAGEHYFAMANIHVRSNGRLATTSVISLPRGLTPAQEQTLAQALPDVAFGTTHPWVAALHRPPDKDNPHVHCTWCNRTHDGILPGRRSGSNGMNRRILNAPAPWSKMATNIGAGGRRCGKAGATPSTAISRPGARRRSTTSGSCGTRGSNAKPRAGWTRTTPPSWCRNARDGSVWRRGATGSGRNSGPSGTSGPGTWGLRPTCRWQTAWHGLPRSRGAPFTSSGSTSGPACGDQSRPASSGRRQSGRRSASTSMWCIPRPTGVRRTRPLVPPSPAPVGGAV